MSIVGINMATRRFASIRRNFCVNRTANVAATEEYRAAANALRARVLATRRRIAASPVLRLEEVAVPEPVQRAVETVVAKGGQSVRDIRVSSRRGETARAAEAHDKKMSRKMRAAGTTVHVLAPPNYDNPADCTAYITVRAPGTRAGAVHVLSELRRLRPNFRPDSVLDFGAGVGVAAASAAKVFGREEHNVRRITLVERSRAMREVAKPIFDTEPFVAAETHVSWVPSLPHEHDTHEIVLCSYILSENVRGAMSDNNPNEASPRNSRERRAEQLLQSTVESLWSRVSPGGYFVLIEDGTAGGFETVLFARELMIGFGASVVAPCLHKKQCPLVGSVTRHRVCRFEQRLNRPLFLRVAKPLPTGYEDEYFSYIVVQKPPFEEMPTEGWGRLVRKPIPRSKHMVLDACRRDGTLARHVLTKQNCEPGMYNVARKARWGDVWPDEPKSGAQVVHF